MTRERIHVEHTTVDTEWLYRCDECGGEIDSGVALFPMQFEKYNTWKDSSRTTFDTSADACGDPLLRCDSCRGATMLRGVPLAITESERDMITETAEVALLAGVFILGVFIGMVALLTLL
jgi:predicted RNA-binding Zn-ribbon protein involved in translation (DUF1610 family)